MVLNYHVLVLVLIFLINEGGSHRLKSGNRQAASSHIDDHSSDIDKFL